MTTKSTSAIEIKSKKLQTLSRSKSLSLSIGTKQRTKKRKTNFLNSNKDKTSSSDNTFRPLQRAVTLSHVVFHNNANESVKKFSGDKAAFSRSNSVSSSSMSSNSTKMKRRTGGSLWSKVSQNRFRSH